MKGTAIARQRKRNGTLANILILIGIISLLYAIIMGFETTLRSSIIQSAKVKITCRDYKSSDGDRAIEKDGFAKWYEFSYDLEANIGSNTYTAILSNGTNHINSKEGDEIPTPFLVINGKRVDMELGETLEVETAINIKETKAEDWLTADIKSSENDYTVRDVNPIDLKDGLIGFKAIYPLILAVVLLAICIRKLPNFMEFFERHIKFSIAIMILAILHNSIYLVLEGTLENTLNIFRRYEESSMEVESYQLAVRLIYQVGFIPIAVLIAALAIYDLISTKKIEVNTITNKEDTEESVANTITSKENTEEKIEDTEEKLEDTEESVANTLTNKEARVKKQKELIKTQFETVGFKKFYRAIIVFLGVVGILLIYNYIINPGVRTSINRPDASGCIITKLDSIKEHGSLFEINKSYNVNYVAGFGHSKDKNDIPRFDISLKIDGRVYRAENVTLRQGRRASYTGTCGNETWEENYTVSKSTKYYVDVEETKKTGVLIIDSRRVND